jgi:hypothetical protein
MKIMRKNLIGIANLHISTIFLLNAGTVPTMWYIFFHFICLIKSFNENRKKMYTWVKYINSVVITDRERDVGVWKNFKVYFKWCCNKSPFDINSLVFHFDDLSYFKSQNYMKIMRKNLIGIDNLHISTIILLNAGTVPTVWYIFFYFIIG